MQRSKFEASDLAKAFIGVRLNFLLLIIQTFGSARKGFKGDLVIPCGSCGRVLAF